MCVHKNRPDDNHLTFMPLVHPLRFTISTRAVDIIDIKTTRGKREGGDILAYIYIYVCIYIYIYIYIYPPFTRADGTDFSIK